MKVFNLGNDTMNGIDSQNSFDYLIYPRESKITRDEGLEKIDIGNMGGTHWTCFFYQR